MQAGRANHSNGLGRKKGSEAGVLKVAAIAACHIPGRYLDGVDGVDGALLLQHAVCIMRETCGGDGVHGLCMGSVRRRHQAVSFSNH